MAPSFTIDLARALDGPEWLKELRATAAGRAIGAGLPGDDIEEWRYSRIGELAIDQYTPVGSRVDAAGADVSSVALPQRPASGEPAAEITLIDGRLVSVAIADGPAAKGLSIRAASSLDASTALPSWGGGGERTHSFVEYTRAFGDPVVVEIPAGLALAGPIVLRSHVTADRGAVFPHLVITAGADSEARVVEWSTSDDVDALVVPLVETELAPASRLTYESVQELGPRVVQIAQQHAVVAQSATHRCFHAALGGARARCRVDVDLVGRGAHSSIGALYLGGGQQVHDLRTFMTHEAPDTTSDIECRGAVDDESHAIYTGLIRITPDGRGARAEQINRIVKLSPHAWAESVPNLEIEHNDVRCSHASAVGPIDADQQFYLETRGVPTEVARRLVVSGFFHDLLARRTGGEVAERVGSVVVDRLGGAR